MVSKLLAESHTQMYLGWTALRCVVEDFYKFEQDSSSCVYHSHVHIMLLVAESSPLA